MTVSVSALTEALKSAKTLDGCQTSIANFFQDNDLGSALYIGTQLPFVETEKPSIVTTLTQPWLEQFMMAGSYVDDPTLASAVHMSLPQFWSASSPERRPDDLLAQFSANGAIGGVIVPVHGKGRSFAVLLVGFESDNVQNSGDEILATLNYVATHIHSAVEKITDLGGGKQTALTAREAECLSWAAQGKTSWETAVILDVAEVTVNFHLKNVMKKLGVSNRVHAVARAVALGIITP